MSPERRSKEIRRCARAMARSVGTDPDALDLPTEAVFARMRAGALPPGVRVPTWRNFEAQAAQTLDGLLANSEVAPLLEDPGKIKWRFNSETAP